MRIQLEKVFQNRNLTLLWLGQMISQSGDSIYQIGLMWLVLELSGSEAITGLVAMSSYLPAVILSLYAGVVADRSDRRLIMISTDLARALLVLIIPLAFYLGWLTPGLMAANAFILAIALTFFNPARDSLIPQIVEKDGLIRANSLIQTSWQLSLLLGPMLAGGILLFAGKIHLFTIDSLAYFISFILIILIKPPATRSKPGKQNTGLRDIKEGLAWTVGNRTIASLLLITVADNLFIMGPAIVGTPIFVRNVIGGGAQEYAIIQGCYAVGMLIGTALILTVGNRFRKGHILLTGMVLDGFTFIPLYYVESLLAMEVTIIIHSIAIPMLTVSRASIIQAVVPEKMTGRVFAMVNLAVVGMSAMSAGMAGFALEKFGAQSVFLMIGTGGGICGIIGWIFAHELRNRR